MSSSNHVQEDDDPELIRDIHALTPPHPPPPPITHHANGRRRDHLAWDTNSSQVRSPSLSMASAELGSSTTENFTSMSREFSALVLAGSSIDNNSNNNNNSSTNNNNEINNYEGGSISNLGMIGEEEEETNPLAIVPDSNPLDRPVWSPRRNNGPGPSSSSYPMGDHASVQRVKKEEVDSKISAWQNAKVAKINNRFKREDAVINGWESEQIQKATSRMKKVERKLEEKRARALEKMQNQVAKARRKAEERRASAEAKRGTKVARVLEVANLMRAVGRAPTKRSFF